ncbi:YafY family protein [Paenibacillus sp. FSL M7-1455]|uniref:helix-turn-helix transcriptional regulator n=1 Tax=Paenibacillus sp. FSL M7-1455 TaxID=2975316 RepID=UPI0030F4E565
MSKTKLLFDLIMYVNSKRHFTAQDVAHEFGVSVRTAHRYLMEISELGVPVYTEQGRNGGYRTLNNRVLPPVSFDENEALAIFFAFRSLRHYDSLPFDADIDSASRKLFALLPADVKPKIKRLEHVLSFWNPKRSVKAPYLKELIEAAVGRRIVCMTYRSKSGARTRNAVPIGVYANDGLWYMPACDVDKGNVRLFRVDRIQSLQISDETYEVHTGLMEWLENYTVSSPVRLVVELTEEGMRQCQSYPWCDPVPLGKGIGNRAAGKIDTVIDRGDVGYTAAFFAGLGKEAKVLEPQEVIDLIRAHGETLLHQYSQV